MSEKKLEECSLSDATHVKMGGKLHELDAWEGSFACKDYEEGHCVGIAVDNKDEIVSIPISLFPILGIKPLKEIKREPIVFEAVVRDKYSVSIPEGIPLGTKFKCVEILEEKK